MTIHRRMAGAGALAAGLVVLLAGGAAKAQSLTVLPVNIAMTPGQMATTLTVINQGDAETSVQIRALAWNQAADGKETLAPSDEVLASPPIVTIAAGATQVVRLVLRNAPQGKEATYRILLDQIPPPAMPGMVRIALRLSIPVFAAPDTRAVSHVQYRVERDAGQAYLVALNDGGRHETVRDIALTTNDGSAVKTAENASPYILAGAAQRWRIVEQDGVPATGGSLRLSARSDSGVISEPVSVVAQP